MTRPSHLQAVLSSLGAVVKSERQRIGISQEELAHRSGLHRTYITDVERGVRNLTLESLLKLTGALEVSISRLFSRIDDRAGEVRASDAQPTTRSDTTRFADILIVDADATNAAKTQHILQSNNVGNPVSFASSGSAALERLNTPLSDGIVPALILLQLRLPDMTGSDFLRRFRQVRGGASTSVVMMLSGRTEEDTRQYRELGAAGVISSPITFAEFSAALPSTGYRLALEKTSM